MYDLDPNAYDGIKPRKPSKPRLHPIEAQTRRDQLAGAVITGFMAAYANPGIDLAGQGFQSPENMARHVVAYVDALIKELDQ